MGFLGGSEVKASACNAGDLGLIPGLGEDIPGEGNGNPLQYCCLENPMDGGTWWATVHGVSKSRTRLSDLTFTFFTSEWHCKFFSLKIHFLKKFTKSTIIRLSTIRKLWPISKNLEMRYCFGPSLLIVMLLAMTAWDTWLSSCCF